MFFTFVFDKINFWSLDATLEMNLGGHYNSIPTAFAGNAGLRFS